MCNTAHVRQGKLKKNMILFHTYILLVG